MPLPSLSTSIKPFRDVGNPSPATTTTTTMREHAWRRVPEAHLSFASAPESWQHKMFQGLPLPFAISHVVVAGGFTTFAGAKHGPFCCCCCFSFSACPPWVGELTHLGRQGYAWQGRRRRRRLASATFTNGNNFNFSDALSRPRTYVAAEVVPRPTCPHPPPTPTTLRHAHPRSPPLAEPKLNTVGCPARTKTLQLKVADLRLGATKKTGKTKKKQQRRWSRRSRRREKNSAKLLQNSGWAEPGQGAGCGSQATGQHGKNA